MLQPKLLKLLNKLTNADEYGIMTLETMHDVPVMWITPLKDTAAAAEGWIPMFIGIVLF